MQATAVANIMTKASTGAGAAASVASDAAAVDGVDFAALLAAQFLGKDEALLSEVQGEIATDQLLLEEGAAQDFKAEVALDVKPIPDPALQAMVMMPAFAPAVQAMQQAAPEMKLAISALSSDKASVGRKDSVLPSTDDAELLPEGDKKALPETKGAAEFAAAGKLLPPVDSSRVEVKAGDIKSVDVKAVDVKAGEIKAFDVRAADARITDVKTTDVVRLPTFTPDTASVVPALMGASQAQAASEVKTPMGVVPPTVGAPGWGDALGQKVVWMAGQNHQVAELHLNPPNLGPMEVRLTINNDQVSAIFVSPQPAVREAIEAAMPRLREMFADSGMTLGNASVSSDSLAQQQNSEQERQSGQARQNSDFPPVDGYSMSATTRGTIPLGGSGRGMVDLFA